MNDPLLDIKDLAHQVKVPVKTIRNKMSNGTWPIPPFRIGRAIRWKQSDVERAIAELAGQKTGADKNLLRKSPEGSNKRTAV